MNKKYDVITIDKDLAVVVDKENNTTYFNEYYYSIADKKLKINHAGIPLHHNLDKERKVIATIGKQIEGLPLVVLPEEDEVEQYIKFENFLLECAKAVIFDRLTHGDGFTRQQRAEYTIQQLKNEGLYPNPFKAAQQKGTYKEEDIQQVSDDCCDSVGYYQVVGKVFQWLIDNDYVVCRKQQPKRFPVAVELEIENMGSKGAYYCSSMADWQLKVNPDNTINPVNVYYE